jgi:hypothetical protein
MSPSKKFDITDIFESASDPWGFMVSGGESTATTMDEDPIACPVKLSRVTIKIHKNNKIEILFIFLSSAFILFNELLMGLVLTITSSHAAFFRANRY